MLITKALALGMSRATKSTLRSIRPLMKGTLREPVSFAMTSLAFCFRQPLQGFFKLRLGPLAA
jgi:hypothetical protein